MSNIKKIKEYSDNINSSTDLQNYLVETALRHSYFKYYAKSNYIDSIIEYNSIFLSTGQSWNDKKDAKAFTTQDKNYTRFGVCLSFSRSESVAMWMLYSGNDGKMIDYSKEAIKSILSASEVELGYFINNDFKTENTINSNDFLINMLDIIYYGEPSDEDEHSFYVKRSDEVCKNFPAMFLDNIPPIKKTVSWSYENECRIILSVNSNLITDKITTAKIEFPENTVEKLIKNNRIYDSPNAKNQKFANSKLKDKINWDLCKDCPSKK